LKRRAVLAGLALGLCAGPAWSNPDASTRPAPDLAALIECRADYPALLAVLPVIEEPLRAVAVGWRPLPQANPFMVEFRLNAPISIFGRSTDHIAFAGDAVIGILDLAEPRTLARELELETGIDTPTKALFGREVRVSALPVDADGQEWEESAILNVSNVDSHPGKTLAGCSYSRSPVETDGEEPSEPAS
jgi:hypothetical protein